MERNGSSGSMPAARATASAQGAHQPQLAPVAEGRTRQTRQVDQAMGPPFSVLVPDLGRRRGCQGAGEG